MGMQREGGGSLRGEKLGRVAKVAAEPSCLGCTGRPPAQRDAGYRSEGYLSSKLGLRASRVRALIWDRASAQVRTQPQERTRCVAAIEAQYGTGIAVADVATLTRAAQWNRSASQ